MPRYKRIDASPRFLAVELEAQLLPGTFEHALNHLLDDEIDLSGFDARFNSDEVGASALPPAMLLKVALLAYSRGIVSSRAIERACREQIIFVALSGDTCPHFTTIAAFVSGLGELIGAVFKQALLICDAQGLVGREMFAITASSCPRTHQRSAAVRGPSSSIKPGRWRRRCRPCSRGPVQLISAMRSPRCRPRRRSASSGCVTTRVGSVSGSPTTPRIARARAVRCARATAPTTSRPRWPRARA